MAATVVEQVGNQTHKGRWITTWELCNLVATLLRVRHEYRRAKVQQKTPQYKRCARSWDLQCESAQLVLQRKSVESLLRSWQRKVWRKTQDLEMVRGFSKSAKRASLSRLQYELFWQQMRLQEVIQQRKTLNRSDGLREEVQVKSRLDILTFGRHPHYTRHLIVFRAVFFPWHRKHFEALFCCTPQRDFIYPKLHSFSLPYLGMQGLETVSVHKQASSAREENSALFSDKFRNFFWLEQHSHWAAILLSLTATSLQNNFHSQSPNFISHQNVCFFHKHFTILIPNFTSALPPPLTVCMRTELLVLYLAQEMFASRLWVWSREDRTKAQEFSHRTSWYSKIAQTLP